MPAVTVDALFFGAPTTHDVELTRRLARFLSPRPGVAAPADLVVSANGTPNMSVNVSTGDAMVAGTQQALQGSYLLSSETALNLAVAASDATNPRIDLVVARVRDKDYSGAVYQASVEVVTGAPAPAPVAPATPANSVVLARVAVAAGTAAIVAGNITDARPRAVAVGASGVPLLYSGSVVNGSATGFTSFITQNAIAVTPVDCVMVVRGSIQYGFAAGDNQLQLRITDHGGGVINHKAGVTADWQFDTRGGKYDGAHIIGRRSYFAGDTVGFRCQYKVDAGNVYVDAGFEVTLEPR